MVNEDILGGLKTALERKQDIKKAMLSLLNAGYEKREIKEAAIELRRQNYYTSQKIPRKTIPSNPKNKIKLTKTKKVSKPSHTLKLPPHPPQVIKSPPKIKKQIISEYHPNKSKDKKPATNVLLILIIALLSFVALGILVLVLAFKEQIWTFFSNLL